MRKIILAVLGLVFALGIYYVTAGKAQIASEIKVQLHKELTTLKTQGFFIQEKESQKEEEHFTLTFDDPQKISHFFTSQGVQLDVPDAEALKGLKLGVDVAYLSDAYSAVSFDLYPLALPNILTQSSFFDADDKTLLQIQALFKKKTFLFHIDVNKLGSGFKGYMKDIDEVLYSDIKAAKKEARLTLKGLTYTGELKDAKLKSVKQNMKHFKLHIPDELSSTFTNLNASYKITGDTLYDYITDYNIEQIVFDSPKKMKLHIDKIQVHSSSNVANTLASGSMETKAKSVKIDAMGKTYTLDTFLFELSAKNLDIKVLDKLQKMNVNNQKERDALFQQLFANNLSFSIPTFSVANMEAEAKKMQGFDVDAKIAIDKSLNITSLQKNPMSAIPAIDANININLSSELFNIIAQQPQAMIALMLFQPKDVKGKKSYALELKEGKLLVNGMPVF